MRHSINLNGPWALRWSDGQRGGLASRLFGPQPDLSRALAAQVPGEVHLDLIRAGVLAEPTVRLNVLAARWVEETIWHYQRTFAAPKLAPGERAFLTFETLDLAATVHLNSQEVGRHANAFYPCRLDVTAALVEGENTLVVVVEAGLFSVGDRMGTGYNMTPDGALLKRNWLRKTQSSFGWDWSPRLLNVGIRGDVTLEICAGIRFDTFVALAELAPDLTRGTLTGRVFVEGLAESEQQGVLKVEIAETGQVAEVAVVIRPGPQPLEVKIAAEAPALWWPVGHGDQPRYTVTATLTAGGAVVGSATRRVGFRRVVVNQAPHPESGRYFVLEVNGKPIFAKGGNFVPAELIFARLDRDRYEMLVDRALEANFNLLRIWGGGLYESDDLYDLCDERGLLVWQEFIFACAKYPATDEHFLADVKREATHQVRRLAHHPSLVVWCGNNEMEWGNYNWGFEKGVAHPDYSLFHMVLPGILKQEDGTRFYQPSSPFSPNLELPNCDDVGDQHPWSVGFAHTDFRDYRAMTCRFPNEGGILGPTALPTILACLPPGDASPFTTAEGALRSLAWEMHDNGIASGGEKVWPDLMLEQWLGRPLTSMSIADYVYWGGVVQGEGLTEYIRNFRRRMFSTASAIFWMYNDCWPAVRSWTIVDYYGRRTPAFYHVRRAFQPLTVAIAREDERVRVYGVNEGPAWRGELRCGLFALAGGYPLDLRVDAELPANASTLIAEFPAAEWLRLGERTHGAFAILSRAGREVARDRLLLPFFKEMAWPAADVSVRWEAGRAIFESAVFAWRVCLDLDGERPLPDNFFDILPGIPTVLDWPETLGEPRVLRWGNQG